MLFVSLPNFPSADEIPQGVDGIELRLDLFSSLDSFIDFWPEFLRTCHLPVLLTIRRNQARSELEREALIRKLFALKPSFFDLEADMCPKFLHWASTQEIQIVLSYHNYDLTPSDLESIYTSMRLYPAYTYKIATRARTSSDALRLLLFAKNRSDVSAICMGPRGTFARVLGPVIGNQIDFGFLDQPTAPGQISIAELLKTYRYKSLNNDTALYGLIGDPVEASLGHLFHNKAFEKNQLNAVYLKMTVEIEELSTFIPLAQKLGFRGLSVTMPLKEHVLPAKGPTNTLFLEKGLSGLSVDGSATVDAIGDVLHKNVVIIGAGGSAQSVLAEATKRGAIVTIINRTLDKATRLAAKYHCKAASLDQVPFDYDVLINCTPCSMPIAPENIKKNATVVDLVYSTKLTPFLREASVRGCRLVYGYSIFENQAKAQFDLWRGR